MALWKDQVTTATATAQKDTLVKEIDALKFEGSNGSTRHEEPAALSRSVAREHRSQLKESVIAADLAIEGKIEGAGHVRIAGRFKGDIHVEGNLTIEQGAHLAGEVTAETIIIAGELEGNIQAAARVELMESGTITGDLKAGSLTVAAGSRMRGKAEFGWVGQSAAPAGTNKRDDSMS